MFNKKIFDSKLENIKSGFYIGNRNYLIWNESCESNIPSFFCKYID